MNSDIIYRKRGCGRLLTLLVLGFAFLSPSSPAATLNVTDFGGIGDCRDVYASVTTNSPVIVTTNIFNAGDVGKIVQLFGAGYVSSLSSAGIFQGNYGGTPTNHQDLVATIVSVANGTNVMLSWACGITASNIRCTYGTQNKTAFDAAIAAAASNDVIHIPAGNYLLMPPSALNTNYVQTGQFDSQPTITLPKGGLTILGDGTNATILTGNGAWQQKGFDSAYRGYMFYLRNGNSAPANNGPCVFNNIQFNGNATRQHGPYTGWPAVPTDGSGWDVTHHAITDAYSPTGNTYKSITNCLFTRWHGETIQGIADGEGFVDIGNCWFIDGNSTVINFNYTHDFHHNLVTDYYQVAEDGQFSDATGVSHISFNIISNIYGATAIALVGAQTNLLAPGYNISSNQFYLTRYAIATAQAKNITINGNYFQGGGVLLGAPGAQGGPAAEINHNIVISGNLFTNMQVAVLVAGSGPNRVQDVLVVSNTATLSPGGGSFFGEAAEQGGSWSTNVVFRQNAANKGLWSSWATGQYLIDDVSNDFPFYTVTGISNIVSYALGLRQSIVAPASGAVYHLDDSKTAQIPPSAVLLVTNAGLAATLYWSTSLVNPIAMSNGYSASFRWTNGVWQTIATIPPPGNLRAGPPK